MVRPGFWHEGYHRRQVLHIRLGLDMPSERPHPDVGRSSKIFGTRLSRLHSLCYLFIVNPELGRCVCCFVLMPTVSFAMVGYPGTCCTLVNVAAVLRILCRMMSAI